jgi:hypothetical protein
MDIKTIKRNLEMLKQAELEKRQLRKENKPARDKNKRAKKQRRKNRG